MNDLVNEWTCLADVEDPAIGDDKNQGEHGEAAERDAGDELRHWIEESWWLEEVGVDAFVVRDDDDVRGGRPSPRIPGIPSGQPGTRNRDC